MQGSIEDIPYYDITLQFYVGLLARLSLLDESLIDLDNLILLRDRQSATDRVHGFTEKQK